MEKVGFEQAIQELTDNNIAVEEVVTDAHLGIGSIMSKCITDKSCQKVFTFLAMERRYMYHMLNFSTQFQQL